MPYRQTRIGALIVVDPKRACSEIERAVRRAGGSVRAAAAALGVDSATLGRWLARLDKVGHPVALDELRARAGVAASAMARAKGAARARAARGAS